jgi:hypothetical protein
MKIAEAMPSSRAAVFVLVGKKPKGGGFDGLTPAEGVIFSNSFDKSAVGTVRAAFAR